MRMRRTAKHKKPISPVSDNVISSRSRKTLDYSAANLKKGLASAPIRENKEALLAWRAERLDEH
jgi:hypothetical protein